MRLITDIRTFLSGLFHWQGLSARSRKHRYAFVACFLLASVAGCVYREQAWKYGWRDFGLADSWPNLLAVPTATFFRTGFFDEHENLIVLAGASTIGFVLYEFIQASGFLGMTFDWKDIVATLISLPVAVAAHRLVDRSYLQQSANAEPTTLPDSPEL